MSGCDHPVDPGDRFCRVCGTPVAHDVTSVGIAGPGSSGSLPAVGSGVAPDLGPGEAVLVVQRGMGGGASYLLVGDLVTAGREPDSDLFLDDVHVARAGGRHPDYREEDGQRVMKGSEITVRVDLHRGSASATVWTCDLSHDYVSINADYRS